MFLIYNINIIFSEMYEYERKKSWNYQNDKYIKLAVELKPAQNGN